jgi:flagellar hook-length control protein FliK
MRGPACNDGDSKTATNPLKMEKIMINQIFTAQQPAVQGKNIKSDAPAAKKADPTPSNSQQSNDPFGAVLAKQIADKKSEAGDKPPPQATSNPAETKTAATKAVPAKAESDIIAAAPDQPQSTLNALLFGNQTNPIAPSVPAAAADSKATDILTASGLNPAGVKKATHQTGAPVSEKAVQATATQASEAGGVKPPATPEFKAELIKASESAQHSDAPGAQALAQTAGAMIAATQSTDARPVETQTTIAAPLGSNAWPDEFSQKVTWICNQQNQVAELHLNPPDLGPMSVVLTVADNQASAVFTSPHSAVREAIENAMPKLRESLAENGIMLGNATVSDQAPRDNGSNNFTQQRSQAVNGKSEALINAPAITAPVITRRHNGMVDTFA